MCERDKEGVRICAWCDHSPLPWCYLKIRHCDSLLLQTAVNRSWLPDRVSETPLEPASRKKTGKATSEYLVGGGQRTVFWAMVAKASVAITKAFPEGTKGTSALFKNWRGITPTGEIRWITTPNKNKACGCGTCQSCFAQKDSNILAGVGCSIKI